MRLAFLMVSLIMLSSDLYAFPSIGHINHICQQDIYRYCKQDLDISCLYTQFSKVTPQCQISLYHRRERVCPNTSECIVADKIHWKESCRGYLETICKNCMNPYSCKRCLVHSWPALNPTCRQSTAMEIRQNASLRKDIPETMNDTSSKVQVQWVMGKRKVYRVKPPVMLRWDESYLPDRLFLIGNVFLKLVGWTLMVLFVSVVMVVGVLMAR